MHRIGWRYRDCPRNGLRWRDRTAPRDGVDFLLRLLSEAPGESERDTLLSQASARFPGLEIAPTLAIEVCPVLIRPALRIVGAEENPRHRVAQCGRAIGDHSLDNHGIATLSDAFPVLICFGHRALAIPTAPHALWFAAVD